MSVVRLEANRQHSLDRHVHGGHVERPVGRGKRRSNEFDLGSQRCVGDSGAGAAYSTSGAGAGRVKTAAGATYSTSGAGWTHFPTTENASSTSAAANTRGADSARRETPNSTFSKIYAGDAWRTGAVPKHSEVCAPRTVWISGLKEFLDDLQLGAQRTGTHLADFVVQSECPR